jgi:uncharacterized membrane-anchored protein YhcB (DUF1043 family)
MLIEAVVSGLVLVVAALAGFVAWLFQSYIPKRLEKAENNRAKMVEIELQKAKSELAATNAEAMRDRAVADSINHAAATNAQALSVIQTLADSLREHEDYSDDLQLCIMGLEKSNRLLNKLVEFTKWREEHDPDYENHASDRAATFDSAREGSGGQSRREG